jgi:hypothetical protein
MFLGIANPSRETIKKALAIAQGNVLTLIKFFSAASG